MQSGQVIYLVAAVLGWALVSFSFWRVKTLPTWLRAGGIIALALTMLFVWFLASS
jgi:hypothetical protein